MREVSEAYLKKERAKLLLSNLKRLRAEVSIVEARYNVLKAGYTELCDDAILKVRAIETDLEKSFRGEIEESEDSKAEMSNLEARFKLGLVPIEVYLKQKETLHEDIALASGWLQSVINKVADCIGFGLDKIADGIILPIEKMINVCTTLFKVVRWKTKK